MVIKKVASLGRHLVTTAPGGDVIAFIYGSADATLKLVLANVLDAVDGPTALFEDHLMRCWVLKMSATGQDLFPGPLPVSPVADGDFRKTNSS